MGKDGVFIFRGLRSEALRESNEVQWGRRIYRMEDKNTGAVA